MSRQFDEYMSDKFELNGTMYQMVEPDSFDELMKAFEIRNVIQMGINQLMHDEDDSSMGRIFCRSRRVIFRNTLTV